jgi:hypothetical protein
MTTRLDCVVIEAIDPIALAGFWSESGPSARRRPTTGRATCPGWCWPIRRATSSVCCHRGEAQPKITELVGSALTPVHLPTAWF